MINILVVDDYMPSVKRIEKRILAEKDFQLSGTISDGRELIKYCFVEKVLPDIVLLDIDMPQMDGVTTMEFLGMFFPSLKVLGNSSYYNQRVTHDMLAAGAWGFVCKDKEMNTLVEAITAVVEGTVYIDRRVGVAFPGRTQLMLERQEEKNSLHSKYGLSKREIEVLSLVVSNIGYKEISEILHIAPKTVEHTIQHITQKLGTVNGRWGLMLHSLRLGLTRMAHLQTMPVD